MFRELRKRKIASRSKRIRKSFMKKVAFDLSLARKGRLGHCNVAVSEESKIMLVW